MVFLTKAFFLTFTLFCISSSYTNAFEHSCNHDEIEQSPGFYNIAEDMSSLTEGRFLASSSYRNIRIYPYYEPLKKSSSSSYASYIMNELVPPCVDYFQSALKVKYPVLGNLALTPDVGNICEMPTPPILRSPGVPADFFIYYDSEASSKTEIASSKYCYLAAGTNRPLVARTMLNRNTLRDPNGDILAHERNMYVLMHEMMHALGFSSNTYKYFVDDSARTRTGHIKSAKIAGKTRIVIDVPSLTSRLRKFYGCSSLQGAIMENNGGTGTSSSHFERKFFIYEAMASGSIHGRRLSEFSLAMLEGSGWYAPNYEYAEPYFYGQGQGCSFMTDKCSTSSSQFEEFCTGSGRGCAPHGRGGGSCSGDSLMEGCKFYSPETNYDCENSNSMDFARLADLQAFGREAGSKCFTGDLNTIKLSEGPTSFCFKYTCTGNGPSTELELQIGTEKITCTKAEQKTVDGYYGSVDCPDPLTFCNTVGKKYCPRNCMGRGSCVNNKCQCKSGYTGVDCALKVSPK